VSGNSFDNGSQAFASLWSSWKLIPDSSAVGVVSDILNTGVELSPTPHLPEVICTTSQIVTPTPKLDIINLFFPPKYNNPNVAYIFHRLSVWQGLTILLLFFFLFQF
jgi:hypothetical protein